jgi:hypothetical protein
MDRRTERRLPTTLIPVQVSGLGDLRLQACGRILDVSHRGVRLGLPESVPIGGFLRIEFEGSVIFGEVRYSEDQQSWHAIGLFVEEILIGESDLARLIGELIQEPDHAQPLDAGHIRL